MREEGVPGFPGCRNGGDTENQECLGTGTRVSIPKDPRTSPKQSQQSPLLKAVRCPLTTGSQIPSDSLPQ